MKDNYLAVGSGEMTTEHKAAFITALLASGLWDSMTPDERADWTERASIRRTEAGLAFLQWLRSKRILI